MKVEIAREDLGVYKWVLVRANPDPFGIKIEILSSVFKYKFAEGYMHNMESILRQLYTVHDVGIDDWPKTEEQKQVYPGFHSAIDVMYFASSLTTKAKTSDMHVVIKAWIPKGSKYILNPYTREIVSEKLMLSAFVVVAHKGYVQIEPITEVLHKIPVKYDENSLFADD